MLIGVPKEIKDEEHRIGMTPGSHTVTPVRCCEPI